MPGSCVMRSMRSTETSAGERRLVYCGLKNFFVVNSTSRGEFICFAAFISRKERANSFYSFRFFNLFEPVKIPARKVAPMCAAFCGFVVFNNLSLQYNPVGVYQLLKVLTTPVIVVLQKATLPTSQMLALIPTCIKCKNV